MDENIIRFGSYGYHVRTCLYVDLLAACNARCSFCCMRGRLTNLRKCQLSNGEFLARLERVRDQHHIYSVEVVGGEPTLRAELLPAIRKVFPEKKLIIVTNGYCLSDIYGYDHIDISRQHWRDSTNGETFGTETVSTRESIKRLPQYVKDKVRFNTVMLAGYIDSVEETKDFIAWANRIGIREFMFAELTKLPQAGFFDKTLVDYTNHMRFDAKPIWDYWATRGQVIKTISGYTYRGLVIRQGGNTIVMKANDDSRGTEALSKLFRQGIIMELMLLPNGNLYADWFGENLISRARSESKAPGL